MSQIEFSAQLSQTQPARQMNTGWYFAITRPINTASILQPPLAPPLGETDCLSFQASSRSLPRHKYLPCHWGIPLPLSIFRECLVCTDAFFPVDWSQETRSSCVTSLGEKNKTKIKQPPAPQLIRNRDKRAVWDMRRRFKGNKQHLDSIRGWSW